MRAILALALTSVAVLVLAFAGTQITTLAISMFRTHPAITPPPDGSPTKIYIPHIHSGRGRATHDINITIEKDTTYKIRG